MALNFLLFTLFKSYLEYTIFSLTWIVWNLIELFHSMLIPVLRHRKEQNPRYDKGSTPILLIAINIGLFLSIAMANAITPGLPAIFFYIGIAIMIAGITIRTWSVHLLGRFFSPFLRIVKSHKLITKGIYKYIRHPSYTGALIVMIGTGFAFRSLIISALLFSILLIIYVHRIRLEEAMLLKRFGKKYARYRQDTYALLPPLW